MLRRFIRRYRGPGSRATSRRGAEAIEFALTLPIFLGVFFGIIEYGWYFFQRAGVVEAAMDGCTQGAQVGVNGNFVLAATDAISDRLGNTGVDCAGYYEGACSITVTQTNWPPQGIACSVSIDYRPISGYLPFVPSSLRANGAGFFDG